MINKEQYRIRREALRNKLKTGVVLILGNDESSRNYEHNYYPFRQDSTFLYYAGIRRAGFALVMDLDGGKDLLFGVDQTIEDVIWTGPAPSLSDLGESAGVDQYLPYDQIKPWLQEHMKERKVHYLPPYRPEQTLKLHDWLGLPLEAIPRGKSINLIRAVVDQRSVKSRDEITLLEKALNMTGSMHLAAMQMAKPGMREYELMSHVHQKALEFNGALSFPIILSINGQILHNTSYANTLKEGDMVLCDAGAEHESGYAGDITRTFPVSRRFTDLQRTIYQIVLDSELAAVDAMKPGVLYREIHDIACRKIVEGLKELGVMKGDVHDAVEAGAHTLFFQCGTGHMMGLDAHDMENLGEEYVGYTPDLVQSKEFGLRSLRLGKALEEGNVVTVEPGIYFIPELMDLWSGKGLYTDFVNYDRAKEFSNFGGIRVEDCYEITNTGSRLLGEPIPRTIEQIESQRVSPS